MWGGAADGDFCSGTGSRLESIVHPYIESVNSFLCEFPIAPDVVDLGCGDFNVGSQLRDSCGSYVAVDVVPELIQRNTRLFSKLAVSFECRDLVRDRLPAGDLAFLRQVLQHLSNAQIAAIIPKLYGYRWVVITEHHPCEPAYVANHDKPAGPGVRLRYGSAVVVTAPPFSLKPLETRELCSVNEGTDIIRTVAYRLQA